MASGTSAFLDAQVQDWVCGARNAWTPPGTLYVALVRAPWDKNKTGSQLLEPTGGAYSRATVSNTTATWAASTRTLPTDPMLKANTAVISFGAHTTAWGRLVSMAVCDASSGGNVLWGGDLPEPIDLPAPATNADRVALRWGVGDLTWTVT